MICQLFFPVGFKSVVSSSHDSLIRLLIPGDHTKKLKDVMAAKLLYRCKHLYMSKFRILSPSLTKK